jgi:hypothetical protein
MTDLFKDAGDNVLKVHTGVLSGKKIYPREQE